MTNYLLTLKSELKNQRKFEWHFVTLCLNFLEWGKTRILNADILKIENNEYFKSTSNSKTLFKTISKICGGNFEINFENGGFKTTKSLPVKLLGTYYILVKVPNFSTPRHTLCHNLLECHVLFEWPQNQMTWISKPRPILTRFACTTKRAQFYFLRNKTHI